MTGGPRRLAAVLAMVAAGLPAQDRDQLALLLRDQAGAPVAGATATLRGQPYAVLAALRDLDLPGGSAAHPRFAWTRARSDESGIVRLQPAEDHPLLSMSGLVTTDAGLGALVVELLPGRAQRLVMTPMAAVTTNTGSEPIVLHARAILPDGRHVPLPPLTGRECRLPAGRYELWAHSADGWTWHSSELRSGQRTLLAFAGPAQRIAARPGAALHPAGRPDLDLLAGGPTAVLRGAALAAPLLAFWRGAVDGPRVLPAPPGPDAMPWPPEAAGDARTYRLGADVDPAGAALFGLVVDAAGTCRVIAAAAPAAGVFRVPPPPPGDTWLLLVARGAAPTAWPWSLVPPDSVLEPAAGTPLAVVAHEVSGDPAVGVALRYEPAGAPAAAVLARTDARGRAVFGRVAGPGTLAVDDERFANQQIELDAPPAAPLPLAVAPGLELRGQVALADAANPAGIVVILRDPRGRLRPAARSRVVGADGAFAFAGLSADAELVLFAHVTRGGRTWSARIDGLRAGAGPLRVELHDEDPDPTPPEPR